LEHNIIMTVGCKQCLILGIETIILLEKGLNFILLPPFKKYQI